MNEKSLRTLAVHTGGIGDLILAAPALEWLARQGPLEIAGYPERLALIREGGVAHAVHYLDTMDFGSLFSRPSVRLRDFLHPFGRAVVWMKDDGAIVRGLQEAGIEDVHCYPGIPPDDWPGHAADYFADCVGRPGIAVPRLRFTAHHAADVLLHPGSGSTKKNWPWKNFLALAEALRAQDCTIAWCMGPAEEALQPPDGDVVLRETPLPRLASFLSGARLCVGNDSGIAHLAAAVGCPTLTLFGPTDPARWAPRGPSARVLHNPSWPQTEEVIPQARALLRSTPIKCASQSAEKGNAQK